VDRSAKAATRLNRRLEGGVEQACEPENPSDLIP
jgi:hypothetical protein